MGVLSHLALESGGDGQEQARLGTIWSVANLALVLGEGVAALRERPALAKNPDPQAPTGEDLVAWWDAYGAAEGAEAEARFAEFCEAVSDTHAYLARKAQAADVRLVMPQGATAMEAAAFPAATRRFLGRLVLSGEPVEQADALYLMCLGRALVMIFDAYAKQAAGSGEAGLAHVFEDAGRIAGLWQEMASVAICEDRRFVIV
ncbi:MAG: hypothetical protein RLY93_13760 [Sumerlaeia bacterium]